MASATGEVGSHDDVSMAAAVHPHRHGGFGIWSASPRLATVARVGMHSAHRIVRLGNGCKRGIIGNWRQLALSPPPIDDSQDGVGTGRVEGDGDQCVRLDRLQHHRLFPILANVAKRIACPELHCLVGGCPGEPYSISIKAALTT